MAARVTKMGEAVLAVNVYALNAKSEREALFKFLLHHIRGNIGPMIMGRLQVHLIPTSGSFPSLQLLADMNVWRCVGFSLGHI